MRRTINNKQFALVLVALQLLQGILILSCRYPDMHWLCVVNIIAACIIIHKYLSDDE